MSRPWTRIGAFLVVAGCWTLQSHAAPVEVRLDGNLALGTAVEVGNLTVWPILADRIADVDAYLTLDEAQAKKLVVVREQAFPSVNALVLDNRSDQSVLVCAGTLIVGGKQDRQIGEDVVVPPKSRTTVPVYCVEQGRWSGGGNLRSINLIASTVVRTAGQYRRSQGRVWRDVQTSSSYPTFIRTKEATDLSRRKRRHRAIVGYLVKQDAARLVGVAHAVDGKPVGLRTFAHPKLLAARFEALVASMCLDAEESRDGRRGRAFDGNMLGTWLILAARAYDRGEYALARRRAEYALEVDPDNSAAKDIIRIAKEARKADGADRPATPKIVRTDPATRAAIIRALTESEKAGAVLPVAKRESMPMAAASDMVALFRDLNRAGETQRESSGTNRNSYRETEKGFQSTCRVRDKDGRWIPLTRDWTAK